MRGLSLLTVEQASTLGHKPVVAGGGSRQKRGTVARYSAEVRFNCPICHERIVTDVDVPETDYSGDNSDERFVEDDADTDCANCNTGFTLHMQNSDGYVAAQIYDHEDVKVDCGHAEMIEADEPDYDDLDIPEHPSAALSQTLIDVRTVLIATSGMYFTGTVHRMAFIQQFAALEAYLSDTLISQVIDKPAVLTKALTSIDELKDVRITLAEIHNDPNIVRRTVGSHLREILFHNFAKVSSIYQAALGFSLFPSKEVRDRMFRVLPSRHDCVHRNGKDKDGNERYEINEAFVLQVDTDMRAMLTWIEDGVRKLT